MTKEPMTKKSFDKLTARLNELKLVQKPKIIKAVDEARQLGDLKENAEYHSAREDQAHIEKTIAELDDKITRVVIIDPATLSHDKVSFGSTVKLYDIELDKILIYEITSSIETDLNHGKISYNSPLSLSLLGKYVGDEVTARLPGGVKQFEIEDIYLSPNQ